MFSRTMFSAGGIFADLGFFFNFLSARCSAGARECFPGRCSRPVDLVIFFFFFGYNFMIEMLISSF